LEPKKRLFKYLRQLEELLQTQPMPCNSSQVYDQICVVRQELGQAASNWDRRRGMVDKTTEAKLAELQTKLDQSQDELSQSQDELEGVKLEKRGVEYDFQDAIVSTGKKEYAAEIEQRNLQEENERLHRDVDELRSQLQNVGANELD
jgi:hypothetical protein